MTVSASPKDTDGANLSTQIATLSTQISKVSSALTKAAMNAQLDRLQRELVAHYMDVGRLTAANILSTMT